MLISFTAENSRSFKQEARLLLTRTKRRAAALPTDHKSWDGWDPYSTVAGIYGANASGKSNFIVAMGFFQAAVAQSHSSWSPTQPIPLPSRFALGVATERPSRFESEFLLEGVRYQYGFEVDAKRFQKEWLYSYPKRHQRIIFERDSSADDEWYFGDSLKGRLRLIAELTRPNSLFLSTAASNNHPFLTEMFSWITSGIVFSSPADHESRLRLSILNIQSDPELRDRVVALLKNADLGIDGLKFDPPDITDSQVDAFVTSLKESPGYNSSEPVDKEFVRDFMTKLRAGVELHHRSENGSTVALPLSEESTGTQALLGLAEPIFDALKRGQTLIIDEIDTSLHPVLVRAIIKLFKSPDLNTLGAQLIFTSHDVSLLMQDVFDEALLDRDQVWFVEKNDIGESLLYPLSDFKPRASHSLLRGYLQGRYGAVPRIEWRDLMPSEEGK